MATDWAAKFPLYDDEHPDIWFYFEKYTLEMLHAGHKRVGHGIIFGRIRYEAALAKHAGDTFKINQNFGAYYARKFVARYPYYAEAFSFRAVREDEAVAA